MAAKKEEVSILFDITKRQAKLIELMYRKKEYLPAKYYADCLHVSERTIFNDLTKLKETFKVFHIEIDKKPNQGIKMRSDAATADKFIQQIMDKVKAEKNTSYSSLERQVFIVKWLLVENRTVTYQSLSMDLYISTTSIIKDLEQIRRFMDDEVKLVSDIKGTRVHGTEIGIQRTIKRFAYYLIEQELHNYSLSAYAKILEPLFDENVLDRVYESMQELIAVLDLNISEQYLKSLFISLLILTERSYQGYHLNALPEVQVEGTEYLANYPLAVHICHNISSHLGFTYTELEHRYISDQLFAHRIEVKVNNQYIEKLFSRDVKQMISDVSEAIEIDLNDDEKLYDSLIYHVFPMIYRLKSDIYVYNPLLNEIKNNYGVLFRIIWYVMENLEEKYDIRLTDDDIAFITIHFQVAIERKEEMSQILIVCQTGLVTSDLIMSRIKNLLPANIQFRLIAKPNLKEEDLSRVDFIVSSVPLDGVAKPVVFVSPLVRDTDLMNIYSYYLKYSSGVKKKEDRELDFNMTSAFLDSRYIFLNEEITTKEACLGKMIRRLEEDGIVKEFFRDSVYEREKLGNTLVHGWAAVPHALSSMANETKIAIMTTKKPIKWNNESSVSFIILLAVAEEDVVHIRKLLGHLYDVILKLESHEKNDFLQSLSKPDDLIALFQGNCQYPLT